MKSAGTKFAPGQVIEWLDCGNRHATVNSNQRVLEFIKNQNNRSETAKVVNSTVIEPCFIGENVCITNSVIGPHVSIGDGTEVSNSVISNSIIQTKTNINGLVAKDSMIGNNAILKYAAKSLSVGDFNEIED